MLQEQTKLIVGASQPPPITRECDTAGSRYHRIRRRGTGGNNGTIHPLILPGLSISRRGIREFNEAELLLLKTHVPIKNADC